MAVLRGTLDTNQQRIKLLDTHQTGSIEPCPCRSNTRRERWLKFGHLTQVSYGPCGPNPLVLEPIAVNQSSSSFRPVHQSRSLDLILFGAFELRHKAHLPAGLVHWSSYSLSQELAR